MGLFCVPFKYKGGIPPDCPAPRKKKALLLLKHRMIGGFDDRVFAIKIHEKRVSAFKNNWIRSSYPKRLLQDYWAHDLSGESSQDR